MPWILYWVAVAGAVLGFGAMLWAGWRLSRRWAVYSPRKRWVLVSALALFEAAYWLNIYAWFIEPQFLVVRRVEIESPTWRGAPITIAALSDTHVGGPHMNLARIGRVVARTNELRPDLVVLLGDYSGRHASESERSGREQQEVLAGIATFAGFNARFGVISVLGNHDIWYGRESVTRALEEAGVATLWDRNLTIARDEGDVVVVGLADGVTALPNYADAIDGAPSGADTIVLMHSPDSLPLAPAGPALFLAGHTHCGQVTVPLIGRPIVPVWHPQYACHRVDEDGKILFVTGGVGVSNLPVRFLNPPEIVLIQLRGAAVAPGSATGEG